MAKIAIKSENITPYGGIFYVMGEFKRTRLGNLLLRWGLRSARRCPWGGEPSPLPMGRRALAAAADRRQPQKQQHKKKKAAGSCCSWLLLLLAPAAVGLRSARQCALRGAGGGFASARRWPWGGREPPPPEQPNSPNSCRRFRPLPRPPSASPSPVRFPVPRPSEAVNHNRQLSPGLLPLFFRRRRSPLAMGGEPPSFRAFRASDFRASGFRAARLLLPPRWILPPLLLEPSNPTTNVSRGTTRTADPCRNGGSCRRCCCHQPGQPTRAGTVDFAAALRRRWILPPLQLNACGGGGSCRRCCWSPRTRPQMFHVEQRNRLWSPTS